jgi:hypothetical protein
MQYRPWLGLCLAIACGACQSERFPIAPVSGTVQFNGQPLANAHVLFQPIAEGTAVEAGPESVGRTDANGQFSLETIEPQRRGAMIGKHRVSVTIPEEEQRYGGGTEDGSVPVGRPKYTLPDRYRHGTELVVEVPPDGLDKLELVLTSP